MDSEDAYADTEYEPDQEWTLQVSCSKHGPDHFEASLSANQPVPFPPGHYLSVEKCPVCLGPLAELEHIQKESDE